MKKRTLVLNRKLDEIVVQRKDISVLKGSLPEKR